MTHRPDSRTASYLLRMRPDEKACWEQRAKAQGLTFAEALRRGVAAYLSDRGEPKMAASHMNRPGDVVSAPGHGHQEVRPGD